VRVACVGGGPAGLYFALLMKLRDPGHDITIFERSVDTSTYGWGVTLGGDLLEKLYRSDPKSAREIDQAAFRWVNHVVDVEGKQVLHAACGGYSISRQRLLDILAHRARGLGVQIEFDQEVMAPSQLPEVDLIVACDGVNSRTRLEAGRFQTDVHLGSNKYIWLGTDKVFESFTFPFVHTGSGWVWAYAYGIDAESSTFIVECSPETWTGLGFDTMPPHDCRSLLGKLFEYQLDGHQLVGQARDDANVRWLNFRTVTNPRWYDGKTVLTGDAAHTTHFTIGSGTKLAIEDVIALADNLHRHGQLTLALESYQRQRQAALLQPQSEARLSAQWFENISRYIDLKPHQFATLLHGRRSPLLPHLPPHLYYQLPTPAKLRVKLPRLCSELARRARKFGRETSKLRIVADSRVTNLLHTHMAWKYRRTSHVDRSERLWLVALFGPRKR
jgi:2-polyprenyl-6-methoxyphenol hydroxylase-like FAD-dependent oxidoreductase